MFKSINRNLTGAFLFLFLSGAWSLLQGEVYQETLEFTEDFENGKAFYLETLSGHIMIKGVEGNMVRVKVVKNVEGDKEEAEEALRKFKVDLKKGRDRIDVVTEFPGENGFLSHIFGRGRGQHNAWVDFEITLPFRLKVIVDATSADVEITNVDGDVSLDLTSGNVAAEDLGGSIIVDGTSGSVDLKNIVGDVVIDNTSGDAVVERCAGSVEIDKTSGEVVLRDIGGDVEVDGTSCDVKGEGIQGYVSLDLISGDVNLHRVNEGISFDDISGDIWVSFEDAPSKESQFSSISGDVTLLIGEEGNLDFDLESVSGELTVELKGLQIQEISKSSLKAYTGDGRVKVTVETVSGDVEIQGNDI